MHARLRLSVRTCSLLRSLSNCWKPSTSVAKLAEIFDVEALRACIVRLLSSSVFKRKENWSEVSDQEVGRGETEYILLLLSEDIKR